MRILQICSKSPYPPKQGAPIAMNNITQGLIDANNYVKVFAVSTPKYFVDIKKIPESYKQKTKFESVFIDTSVKPINAFLNIFSKKSYHIQRFTSNEIKNKLIQILKQEDFDIVQLESLFVTPYIKTIRKYSKAKIILRAHNIEYLIWKRMSYNSANTLKTFYFRHLSKTLKNYEISMLNKYDGIATITDEDTYFFKKSGCKIPVTDIPFGLDIEKYIPDSNLCEFPSLFHIGSMDWMPNQEGIKWFLENVWPEIYKQHHDLKFYLAGRNMPDWLLKNNYPNVIIVGEVKNAINFINSKAIMIVPLLSGAGVRIKIIEAMAAGKTVISTNIAARGIFYENNKNIIIADTPKNFADAITKCINNKDFCNRVGNNAKKLVTQKHNNKLIIDKLVNFYQKILNVNLNNS